MHAPRRQLCLDFRHPDLRFPAESEFAAAIRIALTPSGHRQHPLPLYKVQIQSQIQNRIELN
jgi:hypothetical protein